MRGSFYDKIEYELINNPITGFNFVLEVEKIYLLPLKSVKGFSVENEYEYIQEGGVNNYVHLKKKPISKPFTFQVERYIGTERFQDPLALGAELKYPVILYLYRHIKRNGLLERSQEKPARTYIFTGCVVMSKEYSELNAEQSSLVTESTTISYRELKVMDEPIKKNDVLKNQVDKELKYAVSSIGNQSKNYIHSKLGSIL
ncbi:MAG: hypothetical protein K6A61_07060 [Butyrivibrio sp.]|nr:hypothetical protein [Butyrivibrio sp.]